MVTPSDTTPRWYRQEPRVPAVAYSRLHHDLLKAIAARAVTVHPENYHLILGCFRLHDSVEEGLGWLLVGGYIEQADDLLPSGRRLVLLTQLGNGALRRWDNEQLLVERSGGAE